MMAGKKIIVVICNNISVKIVLIWNYSSICWAKQIYLDEVSLWTSKVVKVQMAVTDGSRVLFANLFTKHEGQFYTTGSLHIT